MRSPYRGQSSVRHAPLSNARWPATHAIPFDQSVTHERDGGRAGKKERKAAIDLIFLTITFTQSFGFSAFVVRFHDQSKLGTKLIPPRDSRGRTDFECPRFTL